MRQAGLANIPAKPALPRNQIYLKAT